MSYRERMEELTAKIRDCFDENPEVAKVAFINYSPQLIDMGDVADKLSADVERLSAIVNMIDLKNERDRLAKRVEELEAGQQIISESV